MIQEDAQRCLELDEKIKALKIKIKQVANDSKIAKHFFMIHSGLWNDLHC